VCGWGLGQASPLGLSKSPHVREGAGSEGSTRCASMSRPGGRHRSVKKWSGQVVSVAPGGSPTGPPRSAAARQHVCVVAARHVSGVPLTRRVRGGGWARQAQPALRGVWETVGHMCPGGAGGMGPHEEGRVRAASAWARPEGVSPLWVPVGEGVGKAARWGCASGQSHSHKPCPSLTSVQNGSLFSTSCETCFKHRRCTQLGSLCTSSVRS